MNKVMTIKRRLPRLTGGEQVTLVNAIDCHKGKWTVGGAIRSKGNYQILIERQGRVLKVKRTMIRLAV